MANSKQNKEIIDQVEGGLAESPSEIAEEVVIETKKSSETAKKNIIPKDIDPSQYVYVRNGFHGKLTYKSRRTGEKCQWNEYGDEQEMELRELRSAKNTDKKFFINNWFMFDDEWVLDYLGVRQYYKNAISIDKFDDIFTLPPAELKAKVLEMPKGLQKSVGYRAQELIRNKEIDSLKVVEALEEALGYDLIEK